MNLTIGLCCNDHRNGLFQGYIEGAYLDLPCGETIELNGPRVKVSYIAKTEVKIGRIRAVTLAQGEWVGNWCWNTVTVSGGSARRIMNYLKLHGWACECAPTEWYDRWREEGEITPEEWEDLLKVEAEP